MVCILRDLVVNDFEYERNLRPTLQDTQSLLYAHEAKPELGSDADLDVGARQERCRASPRGVE